MLVFSPFTPQSTTSEFQTSVTFLQVNKNAMCGYSFSDMTHMYDIIYDE